MDPDSWSLPDLPLSSPAALSATGAWSSLEWKELSTSTASSVKSSCIACMQMSAVEEDNIYCAMSPSASHRIG